MRVVQNKWKPKTVKGSTLNPGDTFDWAGYIYLACTPERDDSCMSVRLEDGGLLFHGLLDVIPVTVEAHVVE